MKRISKEEWVEVGGGLGRMRNPAWARSPEELRESIKSLQTLLNDTLGNVLRLRIGREQDFQDLVEIQRFWYSISQLRQLIDEAERKLKDDLFNLGVMVPEKFDWMPLYDAVEPPKPKTKRRKSK